jgi:hypothetical protein
VDNIVVYMQLHAHEDTPGQLVSDNTPIQGLVEQLAPLFVEQEGHFVQQVVGSETVADIVDSFEFAFDSS